MRNILNPNNTKRRSTNISILTIVLITLFSACNQQKQENNSDEISQIRGWNILSNDLAGGLEVVKAAKDYNINHLQLSHHIIQYLCDLKDSARRNVCNQLTKTAHEEGIEEVVVWDHALYDLSYYPDEFKTGPGGTINLDNPEFWKWFRQDYLELLKLAPDIDGIVLTFIETGAHVEDQYSERWLSEEEKLAGLVDSLANILVDDKGLKLYVRTFIYTKAELESLLKCVDLIRNQEIVIMVKEVPHDFFLTHPIQTYVDNIKRPVFIEFDCGHEYSGQGVIANTFVEKFAERWKYYLGKKNVIGYVARTDRFGDTRIINKPSEILLYTLKRIDEDPEITDDQVYNEFISLKYGEKAIPFIKPAFEKAFDIITSVQYTLGTNVTNHSKLDLDYISSYTRFVSGRWMNDPVVFVGHDVNKKFHYYTDIVNHLSPARYKVDGSRLFEEDPFLIGKGWIDDRELINMEFLNYIITEKNFGVKLAEEALQEIEASKPFVEKSKYQVVYHTFNRTLLTTKLTRACAKAYFGYRIYARGEEFRSDSLVTIIWEGLEEIQKVSAIISSYPVKPPVGGWNWQNDANTALEYYNKIAVSGWPEYNNVVVKAPGNKQ